jgi:TolB-like protein/tRNA A-37 threonylcarbamoyl transferase component Bud32/cytochrome c-type biogenesis protein CcmH/NrfG
MTATLPPTTQSLNDALGNLYAIDRELGHGGTATVYLAQDVRHNRFVALKVLHGEIAESLGAERFLREIQTAARLNHPHILPLFDSGAAGKFLYYVMPYVEGESLRQALDRLGQIPADEAIAYVQEMAAALDYAHRQGIVHRDIKPENVMLHEGIATLMDFGIAKALDADSRGLTQAGMFVGTPAYVSPEQAFGENTIDGRSDQYSLACMLYEMITGQQVFTGSTPQAIIAKRMSGAAPALDDLDGRISPEAIAALVRALSVDASGRYDTMREFAAHLTAGERETPRSMRLMQAPATSAAKSVGVLPFENLSADPENEFLADGIAEEIVGALSKVRTLRVAPRTTSFALKEKRGDLQEVGQKLKVSTVLNGSVRRAGNRIRVNAELVNVSDGSQLWAERYDREMEDVFAIQDDIAESIVRALRVILADSERKALKARTRDVRAYEYYLRGRQYADFRRKSLQYALEMFRRAVEIDPEYASAHAGIADCSSLLYLVFEENPTFLKDAEVASARALELEPDLAESHLSRGMVYSCHKDYENGNREFEMAMRLDPKLFEAPFYWGRNLLWQGKGEEAVKAFRVATALRPESFDIQSMLSLAYANAGKQAESLAARRRALKLIEERLELNPDDPRAWSLAGSNYASLDERERAEEAASRALAIDDDALTYYNVACTYALLKDEDKALDNLQAAIGKGWHHKEWLSHDTDLQFVRDSDRYRRIVAEI